MQRIEQRLASGVFAGALALVFSFGQSLAAVPLLLTFWTSGTYGLWVSLAAVTALLTSFDIGHQNFVGNQFNRLWVENAEELRRTVASAVRIAVAIAVVELAAGFAIIGSGRAGAFLASGGEMAHDSNESSAALLLYLVFWCFNGSVGGVLVRLYPPAGLFVQSQWLGIVMRFAGFLALVLAVGAGASLFGAMAAQVVAWTCVNMVILWHLRRHVPQISPWWRGGSWRLGWRNFRDSLVMTINGALEQLASSGLVLVVARSLAPAQVAVFSTLRTVANIATQGSGILVNPLLPDLVRFHVRREPAKLSGAFVWCWFIGCTAMVGMLVLLLPFLETLYGLWTRGRLAFNAPLFGCIASAICVRQWSSPIQTYLFGINSLLPQALTSFVRAGGSLLVALVTIPFHGITGAGIGLFVGECLAASVALFEAKHAFKQFEFPFPAGAAALALAQVAIANLAFIAFALQDGSTFVCAGVASAAIIFVGWIQWCKLPREIRMRMSDFAGLLRRLPRPQYKG